jgi:hypothetical protein
MRLEEPSIYYLLELIMQFDRFVATIIIHKYQFRILMDEEMIIIINE